MPGSTETHLLISSVANVIAKTGHSAEEALADSSAGNPQQRIVQPADVADAARWLSGEGAASVTGQSISVSGRKVA